MPTSGRMKKAMKIWTRKGVPRMRSTHAPTIIRKVLYRLARMIPKISPTTVPARRLRPEIGNRSPQPLEEKGQGLHQLREMDREHVLLSRFSARLAENEALLSPP